MSTVGFRLHPEAGYYYRVADGAGPFSYNGAQMVPATGPQDVTGRTKMSVHQNIYDADFEYGPQPLRWDSLTVGGGTVTHLPSEGGVRIRVGTAAGDVAMRQSRPYMRYQPGKTLYMASAVLFGAAAAGQTQRVGFFDDGNGVFFEQAGPTVANPSGLAVVLRSDTSGVVTDTRVELPAWNGDSSVIARLDWTRIQMVFVEYAWYGAGAIRWGVLLDGQPITLHAFAQGNRPGQTRAWARTGNLPVRYELRNTAGQAGNSEFIHYGVSVMVEGRADEQRGFTYSYGMAPAVPRRNVAAGTTRFPVLSVRGRTMGTIETTQVASAITAGTTTSFTVTGTPWTVNQWQGRAVFFPGLGGGNGLTARIVSNTTSSATVADPVTGGPLSTAIGAAQAYQIGLVNRGQLLPRTLLISADAVAVVELVASAPSTPVTLTGASFVPLSSLGSANSFAERDVSATSLTGGEVVMAFTAPAGGSGVVQIDLEDLFPLLNTIRGNQPDILTVAITTPAGNASNVGVHIICQEAMS